MTDHAVKGKALVIAGGDIRFLVSEGLWMTGQTILVNGG
ncbi:hypothetical protein C7450_102219 [Chelatococcus asaccharovorans]|uniref:Uncharacterized protein n=1 Tax=Chelatococcus asaccharovorans TaxID=28210 RepID=A0A2V3UE87_9HYPH|nr:hypothetical protein C7450_102219 [Chelatococcus asaccharovorans]